ncbi:MAG: threonine synthase, partial [Clostridiaceae bacterium]|nr:threonine synthase [Clostridiaceae bacterium]
IASTASPYKFNRSVLQALGEEDIEDQNEFILLEKLAKKTQTRAPKALQELEVKPVRFNQVITKDQMKEVVKNYLFNS